LLSSAGSIKSEPGGGKLALWAKARLPLQFYPNSTIAEVGKL